LLTRVGLSCGVQALVWDPEFKKYVELYAKDEGAFFKDFAAAFQA
jgi:catalase (peroxidase I)